MGEAFEFNLVDEGWIRCEAGDGSLCESPLVVAAGWVTAPPTIPVGCKNLIWPFCKRSCHQGP